jgi:hypothetical protein
MIYQIVFNNNETYSGGESLFDTKWKEIPLNKKIRTIIYFIPTQAGLMLSGFERIYHYVEAVKDLNGVESGKIKIEFSYLIIERDNKYIQYRINQKSGDVEINVLDKDSKYIAGLNPTFWR